MNATQVCFESRFGFHPCDKETFKMLKFLHKHWHITQRQLADLERWECKEPQNRVIREWLRDDQGRKYGSRVVGPRPEPQACPLLFTTDKWGRRRLHPTICQDYQNARTPRASQEEVSRLTMSEEQISDLYNKVRDWFGQ